MHLEGEVRLVFICICMLIIIIIIIIIIICYVPAAKLCVGAKQKWRGSGKGGGFFSCNAGVHGDWALSGALGHEQPEHKVGPQE